MYSKQPSSLKNIDFINYINVNVNNNSFSPSTYCNTTIPGIQTSPIIDVTGTADTIKFNFFSELAEPV